MGIRTSIIQQIEFYGTWEKVNERFGYKDFYSFKEDLLSDTETSFWEKVSVIGEILADVTK